MQQLLWGQSRSCDPQFVLNTWPVAIRWGQGTHCLGNNDGGDCDDDDYGGDDCDDDDDGDDDDGGDYDGDDDDDDDGDCGSTSLSESGWQVIMEALELLTGGPK